MIKLIVSKRYTYVLSHESSYFQIHKNYIFSISKPDWRRFRDFQPYVKECYHVYHLDGYITVCIYILIIQMSHLTRIALSPDDASDYENTNRNMRDLDPDYNCLTNNNVLTTKILP